MVSFLALRVQLRILRRTGCLLLLLRVHALAAQLPVTVALGKDYLRTDFTMEDGLPSNVVHSMLQTRDGFLWIGTKHGLLRYDGHHFATFNLLPQELAGTRVITLGEAADGSLWAGTEFGLAHISRQFLDQLGPISSELYHPGSGPKDDIESLRITRGGKVWVGTRAGLYRFDRGKFVCVIPDLWISRIEEASSGHLLIITSLGLKEWDGRQIIDHSDLSRQLGVELNGVFHVFEDRGGTIWYCSSAGIARQQPGHPIQRIEPYGIGRGSITFRAFEDESGTVWFNRLIGLSRATPDGVEVFAPGLHASYMADDRDGNLWVATNGSGLIEIRKRAVYMYTTDDGLPNDTAKTVLAARDGNIWVGNNCGGLSWFDGKRFHTYSEKDGLTNSCVISLAEDATGSIWVGTGAGGVFRFKNGRFTQFSNPDRLANSIAYAIICAHDRSMWIAYSDGLSRIQNGYTRKYTIDDGLSSNNISSVYEDRAGTIWVQTSAGIDRLKNGRFEAIASTKEAVFDEDRFGGLFAIVPRTGTFRIQGKHLARVSRAPQINSMVTSQTDLWFCGKGIYRAASDSLEKWGLEGDAQPDYTIFGYRDGLTSSECAGGFRDMAITRDGKLWVATTKGVAMLDPSKLKHSNRKPSIYIENVVVGKELRSPGTDLTLQPGANHVEIHFDAIEVGSPEGIRFQYRLDGVDKEWLDADELSAVYTGLPAGAHAFHVRACNGEGVWDKEGLVYEITQQPYFYETTLFRAAVAAFGILLLFGLYRLRLRQLATRINLRLEERVAERTRIARDLHDTLIQDINGLSLQIAALSKVTITPKTAKDRLQELKQQAEYCLREARQSVWDIRSAEMDSPDFLTALRESGEQLTAGKPTRFSLISEGAPKHLSANLRQQLLRIGREAIGNAAQHAHAEEIEVRVNFDAGSIRVRVSDNGRGFDVERARQARGHFGLATMNERAEQIEGTIQISSTVGKGTSIEIAAPAGD